MESAKASPAIKRPTRAAGAVCLLALAVGLPACSATHYREKADTVADEIIETEQREALGRTEPFRIETPEDTLRRRLIEVQGLDVSGPASIGTDLLDPPDHWPEEDQPRRVPDDWQPVAPWDADEPVVLSLLEALQVGARSSRDYQTRKENVFRAALDLDLELNVFRNTYFGLLDSFLITDGSGPGQTTGIESSGDFRIQRRLESGALLTGRIALDLAQLLSSDGASSFGIFADASVTIPLMRGSGRHIVTEPLTQAERDVVYAIWDFEEFKRDFAVRIASDYLAVLQNLDRVQNAEANYRGRILSVRRTRRLADAGRADEPEVDQARQAELRARDQWLRDQRSYELALDRFKVTLGLPADAHIDLDRDELTVLAEDAQEVLGDPEAALLDEEEELDPEDAPPIRADDPVVIDPPDIEGGGPFEMPEEEAIRLALDHRLDLRTRHGEVFDAQRRVVVAADALRMDLDLLGTASMGGRRSLGSAGLPDARLRPSRGVYSAGVEIDLPWERTAERNVYRDSYIRLEQAARQVQELEDQIKLTIRDGLRTLLLDRETYRIQALGLEVAERRVASTTMFMDAGDPRVQIRDVLEAQDALLAAENALTAALVGYRISELELQRDMGLLQVDQRGLWREYDPEQAAAEPGGPDAPEADDGNPLQPANPDAGDGDGPDS